MAVGFIKRVTSLAHWKVLRAFPVVYPPRCSHDERFLREFF